MTQPQAWWKEPTRGQWMAFLAAWFGWVLDAFDFTVFILVIPSIAKEFGVSMTAAGSSLTLTLLVRLLGGVAAGWAADRWGRKLPLMISVIWFAVCDGAVALAPSFAWVLVLRTLFGFGMGAEWTSGATLAMENWPARSRGIASGILQGSWAIGYLLAGVASAWILPIWGWRGLFVAAALPALMVFPIRFWVPESPEWQKGAKVAQAAGPSLRELLAPGLPKLLGLSSVVMALGFCGYYGLVVFYPSMLQKELHLGAGEVAALVAWFNVGMLAGSILCGYFASRRGAISAIVIPALVMIPLLPMYIGTWPGLLPVGALLGGAFGAGYCGVTPLLLTSIFPARVRARCVGLVYHLGAFGAAFVSTVVPALSEHAGLSLAQSIAVVAGGSMLTLALAVFVLPRSTEPEAPPAAAASVAAQLH